jgi:hypothetical protein
MARKSLRSARAFQIALVAVLAAAGASGIAMAGATTSSSHSAFCYDKSNRVVHFSPKGRCDVATQRLRVVGDGSNGARGPKGNTGDPGVNAFVKVTSLPSSANSGVTATVTATCPMGDVVISGGSTGALTSVTSSAAVGTNDAWQVVYVSSGAPVNAFAICVPGTMTSVTTPPPTTTTVAPTTTIAPTTTTT